MNNLPPISSFVEDVASTFHSANKDTAIADNGKAQLRDIADMLPDNMLAVLTTLTGILCWEPDYCLLPMIVTAAAAIGNARCSEIAGYTVHSILYGCSVGAPSVNKSEPLKFATKPLRDIFAKNYAVYQHDYTEWEKLPDAERKGKEPRLVETVFNDITIEKVTSNLQYDQKGALLAVDELKGFLNTFTRYTNGNAEQKYIELFTCTPLTDSRMGRKTVHVPAPYLSIIGTTQPDVIHRTFRNAADNGLKERLLMVYSDVRPTPWNKNASSQERGIAEARWAAIIEPLYELQAGSGKNGSPEPVNIRFTGEARQCLYDWQQYNTNRKISQPQAAAMLGKADIICPRLALILQLIEQPDSTTITEDSAIRAINLMEYFIQHGQKVMQLIREGVPDKPNAKQMLFASLPSEFTTQEAVIKGVGLGISERTIKRYVDDTAFCINIKQGVYAKV